MSYSLHTARRATLDDLPALRSLWQQAGLPVSELERHLTDFQLVLNGTGEIVGALGLRLAGKQARLHSEAYVAPAEQDGLRPLLWERLQTVARNHGLVRLWLREPAPFWSQCGFRDADTAVLKKLPAEFGPPTAGWQQLQLREESVLSLEQEFELFQTAQREETEAVLRQARVLKFFAGALAVLFFAAIVAGLFYLWRHGAGSGRR